MSRIIAFIPAAHVANVTPYLLTKPYRHVVQITTPNNDLIVIALTDAPYDRFELSQQTGVYILPAPHCTDAIGTVVANHLSFAGATSTMTWRQLYTLMFTHSTYGHPLYDPDL